VLVNIMHEYTTLPNKDFNWTISVRNGEKVVTKVYRDNYKTREFAIDYRWCSPGLAIAEKEIHDYFSNEMLFLDIGSNLGMRSLVPLSSGRTVFMFEPNSETNKLNEERCKLNGFSNYTIVPFAVSARYEKKTFYFDESSYLSSFIKPTSDSQVKYRSEVFETITIDGYLNIASKSYEGFIMKIDVEGHEWEVIRGAHDLISKYSPTLLIEINEKGGNIMSIIKFFQELEYRIFEINTDLIKGLLTEITDMNDNDKANITSSNFLFLKEKPLINILETK